MHRSLRVIYYLGDEDQRDPGLRRLPDYFSHSYPRMLLEDVGTAMVPFRGARVGFHPADEAAERIVAEAISLRDYTKDLAWAAHQFFNMCAQRVMAYGEDVHAVVYLSKVEGEKPVGFDVVPVHPATVTRHRGKLAQYVPRSQRRPDAPEFIELPPDQTIVFQAPEHLRAPIARSLEGLATVGHFGTPDWAMEDLGMLRKRVPFDTNAHIRAHRLAVANACNELGWDARGIIDEDMLEYYVLHRRLRFERFKIELREHLLDTLNEGLAQAGDEIGFSGKLTLEGVPSLSDVDAAESHLAAGDIPFNNLIEPFMPY